MKIVIMGTGSWGTALAQVLADNQQEVWMWGIDEKQVNDINENHHNYTYFEDPIHPAVKASLDIATIKDADVVLLAVPSIALASTLDKLKAYVTKPIIIINVAKGFHPLSHKRLSVVIEEEMPKDKLKAIVSLIGPSHAEEVIQRKLTVINAVSLDEESATTIQHLFSNDYFRVYRNQDVIGAEIGVALKNVMAIASGILEGVGQGVNARAALMTRGLAEMERYGVALGAKKETFLGLDGVGDLIVTCTSTLSRNFSAGLEIGKANGAKDFMANNKKTVEGIFACKIVYEEAKRLGIDMPITNAVYAVLYDNAKPQDVIVQLMRRDLKSERE